MKQQATISMLLEGEHRRIDARFKRFVEGLASDQILAEPLEKAAELLHRHIYLEEELLFPEIEAQGLVGPTAVMAMEHGEICRSLGVIRDLIQEKASPERIGGIFNALYDLLEEHNFKEERVLYPSADRLLETAQVVQRLKEANAPEGWMCRVQRAESQ